MADPSDGSATQGTDSGNNSLIDPKFFNDLTNIKNTMGWQMQPVHEVGNNCAPIQQCLARQDNASMSGSRSQNYTTYNCTTRSILVALCHREKQHNVGQPMPNTTTLGDQYYIEYDINTIMTTCMSCLTLRDIKEIRKGATVMLMPTQELVRRTAARERLNQLLSSMLTEITTSEVTSSSSTSYENIPTMITRSMDACKESNRITSNDYVDCLNTSIEATIKQNLIKAEKFHVPTATQTKVAPSPNDDKRFLIEGTYETLPWGHYSIMKGKLPPKIINPKTKIREVLPEEDSPVS